MLTEQFFQYIKDGNFAALKLMVKSDQVDVNILNADGYPALYFAVSFYPRPELAEVLLQLGADPNIRTQLADPQAMNCSLLVWLVRQGCYLFHHGHLREPADGYGIAETRYKDFFSLATLLKNYGAVATKEDLEQIEFFVSEIEGGSQFDYIYDPESFARKLVDLFANSSHQFKRIQLSADELIRYRACCITGEPENFLRDFYLQRELQERSQMQMSEMLLSA